MSLVELHIHPASSLLWYTQSHQVVLFAEDQNISWFAILCFRESSFHLHPQALVLPVMVLLSQNIFRPWACDSTRRLPMTSLSTLRYIVGSGRWIFPQLQYGPSTRPTTRGCGVDHNHEWPDHDLPTYPDTSSLLVHTLTNVTNTPTSTTVQQCPPLEHHITCDSPAKAHKPSQCRQVVQITASRLTAITPQMSPSSTPSSLSPLSPSAGVKLPPHEAASRKSDVTSKWVHPLVLCSLWTDIATLCSSQSHLAAPEPVTNRRQLPRRRVDQTRLKHSVLACASASVPRAAPLRPKPGLRIETVTSHSHVFSLANSHCVSVLCTINQSIKSLYCS